jgi:uncharacterized protein (TIGR03083 family)
MPAALSADELCAALVSATATLAGVVGRTEQDLRIPSCPDWTMRQLATHVGRAHRWAAEIVSTRSERFIEFRSVPDGKPPPGAAGQAEWLTTGAASLAAAVAAAGDDLVWAFLDLRPAAFWARRMANETLVHCVDAQLAAGDVIEMQAGFAADAIDEWLTVMSPLNAGEPDLRSVLPPGAALHVLATGPAGEPAGEWRVIHGQDGVRVLRGPGAGVVGLAGPAGDVLLVLMRRLPVSAPSVQVGGDAPVLDRWLALTAF